MKSSKTYLILLLTATTLGGAALAWQQYGELVELRASALNRDERADLQKRVWELEKLNRELRDQLAALSNDPDEFEGLFAEATDPNPEAASRDRGERGPRSGDSSRSRSSAMQQMSAMRELMSKPEVQAMVSLQQKAAIEARYAALFKNLNLPVEQIDKLKTLLADRTTTMQDVMVAAREQGISPRENPEAFRKLVSEVQDQINSSIKSVIGEQGFAQLSTYEKTMPQRSVVNDLQQRLSYTGVPLTSAQSEQMVQILAANTPQRQPGDSAGRNGPSSSGSRGGPPLGMDFGPMISSTFGGGPGGNMSGRGSAPVTSAAVNQAQTVLAPPQVAALQQIQQEQQTQQQLRQLVSETMAANRPTSSKSTGKSTSGAPNTGSGGAAPPRRRGSGG